MSTLAPEHCSSLAGVWILSVDMEDSCEMYGYFRRPRWRLSVHKAEGGGLAMWQDSSVTKES
jgi:hypothetical protein